LVTKGVTHVFSELGIKDDSRGNVRSTSDIAYEAVELLGG
jgi:isopentenyldiphosphate isomerase